VTQSEVTVALPVRNGGALLARTLAALAQQTVAHELLVCDSGSQDSSLQLVASYGARVLEIDPVSFTHGGVRNLLMHEAQGAHVALLSQDAEPVEECWLERLLGGFALAEDIGIVYGPYRPRPDVSLAVRLELERWFASLSPDGGPTVERLGEHERSLPVVQLVGRRGFFTDANACIARAAWEQAPFRDVRYAEDRLLALDMLRAGYAKAFVPAAAVWHSHSYTTLEHLRRCFDEWRGLREVYGWHESAQPMRLLAQLRGELAYARRELGQSQPSRSRRLAGLIDVGWHHAVRLLGATLGSHADTVPNWVRASLSLERHGSFQPVNVDDASPTRASARSADRDKPQHPR
jgi:glycosyltransferase involved in cell wall biosynthesis